MLTRVCASINPYQHRFPHLDSRSLSMFRLASFVDHIFRRTLLSLIRCQVLPQSPASVPTTPLFSISTIPLLSSFLSLSLFFTFTFTSTSSLSFLSILYRKRDECHPGFPGALLPGQERRRPPTSKPSRSPRRGQGDLWRPSSQRHIFFLLDEHSQCDSILLLHYLPCNRERTDRS